ncbi:MAG: hypothetical protein HOL48_11265 [Porticoccaceae bacterium]|nr:hypothetical protein [Porticoccaceae bacterium]
MRATSILLTAFIALSLASFSPSLLAQPPGGGMGGGGAPDFSEAAKTLGITEDELIDALGGPPPNFSDAAEKLGISEEELLEVLPAPPEGGRPQN